MFNLGLIILFFKTYCPFKKPNFMKKVYLLILTEHLTHKDTMFFFLKYYDSKNILVILNIFPVFILKLKLMDAESIKKVLLLLS